MLFPEVPMPTQIPLTDAKTRLSELVRNVRRTRDEVTITVDGEPAAVLAPVEAKLRDLTAQESATARALFESLLRLASAGEPFDAVALVREGRR
jgi:prevent-host-death family protein